jgi:hypothetical protein
VIFAKIDLSLTNDNDVGGGDAAAADDDDDKAHYRKHCVALMYFL